MDLRLFWGVVKRYKRTASAGTILAVILAVLVYGTPSFAGGKPTIIPRGSDTYESAAELLITQGAGLYSNVDPKAVAVGAPGYMSSLSPIYAGLANGDAVQAALRGAKVPGTVTATEGVDPLTGAYTPFVDLTAQGPTAADAEQLVKRGVASFQNYVSAAETNSGVPANSRVQLEVIKSGLPAVLAAKPKPTIAILVFLAILAATIAMMFSMENRDPQTAAKLGRVAPAEPMAVSAGGAAVPDHIDAPRRSGERSFAWVIKSNR